MKNERKVQIELNNTQDVESLVKLFKPESFKVINVQFKCHLTLVKLKRFNHRNKVYYLAICSQMKHLKKFSTFVKKEFRSRGCNHDIIEFEFNEDMNVNFGITKTYLINNYNLMLFYLNLPIKERHDIDNTVFDLRNNKMS